MNRRNLIKLGVASALILGAGSMTSIYNPNNHSKTQLEERLDNRDEEYPYIRNFLTEPFNGFGSIELPASFKIITLSNIAEGLVKYSLKNPNKKEETTHLLDKIIEIAYDSTVSPYSKSPEQVNDLGDNGLYLSHLNIIYGMQELLTQDNKNFEINKRISNHLAKKSLADKTKNIKSFNNYNGRWPADQTATLYSIYLFDKNHNTNISSLPIQEWINYMEKEGSDKKTGLPLSEISGIEKTGECPRGCALSWSVYYMTHFAPEEAKKLWVKYKEHYKENAIGLFSGFREWPKDYNGFEDNDTGPIIFGIGTAATAFGIRAANAMNDDITSWQLKNSERVVSLGIDIAGKNNIKELANSIFPKALRFNLGYVNYYKNSNLSSF